MNQIKLIFKNTSWMTVSQLITGVCAFIWTILIARYLGVSDYGILSFAVSFTGVFGVIMDIGMNSYSIREISRYRDSFDRFVGNIVPFKFLLAVFSFFVCFLVLFLLGFDYLTIFVTLLFVIEMAFMSFAGFFSGVFAAFEELRYQAVGTILNSLFLFIGVLLAIYFDLGLIYIAFSYVIGYGVYLLFMVIVYLRNFGMPSFDFDLSFLKNVIFNSVPFGLTNCFYTTYFSIDIVMLTYLVGNYPTGLYRAAYNVILIFTTLFTVYTATVFPVMSKFFVESKYMLRESYEVSIKYLLILILPLCVFVFLYAGDLINLLYGGSYSSSAVIMQILIFTLAFLFVNGAGSVLLNSSDFEINVTFIYFIAAVVNVILNVILIPNYSYCGAAVATLVSEIVICGLILYNVSKTDFMPDLDLLWSVIKVIISSLFMGFVLYFSGLDMGLAILVGLVVYVVMLFVIGTFDNRDKHIIKELLDND